jgi:hypothetical protein
VNRLKKSTVVENDVHGPPAPLKTSEPGTAHVTTFAIQETLSLPGIKQPPPQDSGAGAQHSQLSASPTATVIDFPFRVTSFPLRVKSLVIG